MRGIMRVIGPVILAALLVLSGTAVAETQALLSAPAAGGPFDCQVAEQVERLGSLSVNVRAGAAEALAYLRAYAAGDALAEALNDRQAGVRREAAMALAWCGGRRHVPLLIRTLDDEDWVVRQAARVSLTNLTGMEWPFDALGPSRQRDKQAAAWHRWWTQASKRSPPTDVLALPDDEDLERRLRAVRALGALGGSGASEAILKAITPYRELDYVRLTPLERHLVQAGLRSLGRLRQPEAFEELLGFFKQTGWARYAADALGEFGDRRAIAPMVAAYPKFAWGLKREVPKLYPRDDNSSSGMSPEDRMYETPYVVSVALARLPLDDPADTAVLRRIVPHLAANMPSDWDGGMLYEPEAFEAITAYLLERAGLRRAACEAAFQAAAILTGNPDKGSSGNPRDDLTPEQNLLEIAKRSTRDVPWFAGWLPALCRDQQDVPRLIELLEHDNGWVRINAAKALMFMGADEAIVSRRQRWRGGTRRDRVCQGRKHGA